MIRFLRSFLGYLTVYKVVLFLLKFEFVICKGSRFYFQCFYHLFFGILFSLCFNLLGSAVGVETHALLAHVTQRIKGR